MKSLKLSSFSFVSLSEEVERSTVSMKTLSASGREPPRAVTSLQVATPWVLKAVPPTPVNLPLLST